MRGRGGRGTWGKRRGKRVRFTDLEAEIEGLASAPHSKLIITPDSISYVSSAAANIITGGDNAK